LTVSSSVASAKKTPTVSGVAALAEHRDQAGVGDGRRPAHDGDGAAVDQDRAGRIAAGDDRIVGSVAKYGEGVRSKGGGDSHDRELLFWGRFRRVIISIAATSAAPLVG
jgi:hypothetical protein